MNSICILLTDHESINEEIIINSYKELLIAKINKIYFVGCQIKFKKIYKKFNLQKKFKFINANLNQNQYFEYLRVITYKAIEICKKEKGVLILNMPLDKKKISKK